MLDDRFGSSGRALNAALAAFGLGEADFDVTENTGGFLRYTRTEDAWDPPNSEYFTIDETDTNTTSDPF